MLKGYLSSQSSNWEGPITEASIEDAFGARDSTKLESLLKPLALSHMRNIDSGENLCAIKLEDLDISKKLSISERGLGGDTADILKEFCGDDYSGILQVSDQHGKSYQVSPDVTSQAFALHSITKVFTGILICEMIAKGIISEDDLNTPPMPLDSEVVAKLPPKVQERIGKSTLHQAMTHTSGLQDYLGKYLGDTKQSLESGEGVSKPSKTEDFLQFVEDSVSSFEPGEGRFYSNTGILLAGLSAMNLYNSKVPEGQRKAYDEMLKEAILQPSGIGLFSASIPEGKVIANPDHLEALEICGSPAGGGGYWTTVEEMEKFGHHLCERWKDPAFRSAVETYGGEVDDAKSSTIGHSGGIPGDQLRGVEEGSSSWFSVDLDSGITVVAASVDSKAALLGQCVCGAVNDVVKEKDSVQTADSADVEPGERSKEEVLDITREKGFVERFDLVKKEKGFVRDLIDKYEAGSGKGGNEGRSR